MGNEDKSMWPAGAWSNEPDELSWVDEKTGYACHMRRNHSGAWCGYVEIPQGHPLHGVSYGDTLPESLAALKDVVMEGPQGKRGVMDVFCLALGGDFTAGVLFNVHGGVTYSGEAYWLEGGPGHWYGFDCSHCDDVSPALLRYGLEPGAYRDLEYVKAECASLAKQLKQVQG
jgi:hypothetical protein